MLSADFSMPLIRRYAEYLPVNVNDPIVSLGEGYTPLIRLRRIEKHLGHDIKVYAKFEGANPTGSFKDRGMTMAVTHAKTKGAKAIICASTGNTSASAAAYGAVSGLKVFVLIPKGNIALGKLAQAMMHGAVVLQIEDNFDKALQLVRELGEELPIEIVNSINPYRLEGQKTISFEIVDELQRAPDYHYLPVGNAGNISAHYAGYHDYVSAGKIESVPHLVGFQASGAAPFLRGGPVENPETVATAIRIGHPASWDKALAAQQSSKGWFGECPDEDILSAQRLLAQSEGIFCEPASSISIAGLIKDVNAQKIPSGSVVVCTLTGHGLKDPDIAIAQSKDGTKTIPADKARISEEITQALATRAV